MFTTLSGRRASAVSNEPAQTRFAVEDENINYNNTNSGKKAAAVKPSQTVRFKSVSYAPVLDPADSPSSASKYELRVGGEQGGDHNTLRDLAKFFRATSPPSDLGLPRERDPMAFNSGGKEAGKRSISSMMKLRRARSPSQSGPPAQPSDPAGPRKSSQSIIRETKSPVLPEIGSPWSQSPYLDFDSDFTQRTFDLPVWPGRTASLAARSPTYLSQVYPASTSPNLFSASATDISVFSAGLTETASEATQESIEDTPDRSPQPKRRPYGSSLDQDAAPREPSITSFGPTRSDQANGTWKKSPYLHISKVRTGIEAIRSSDAGVKYPITPPPSGQLEEFGWPDRRTSPAESTPAPTQKLLHERRHESKPTSPKSDQFDSRKLSTVVMNPTLAVPNDYLPPDSPGFPTMLASMTFPSPPKSSAPSMVATPVTSRPSTGSAPGPSPPTVSRRLSNKDTMPKLPPTSAPTAFPPTVNRRVSSRDATAKLPPTSGPATTSAPTVSQRASSRDATALPAESAASLDEIVMRQARPGLLQSKSDQTPLTSRRTASTSTVPSAREDFAPASRRTESTSKVPSMQGDCAPTEVSAEKKAIQVHARKPSWMHSRNPSAVPRAVPNRNSSAAHSRNSSAVHSRNPSTVHSRKNSSTASRIHSRQASLFEVASIRPDSAASFFTACEERRDSTASLLADATELRRQSSTWSSSSTTTASHKQSTWTENSQRQSTRSDATTISTVPSIPDEITVGTIAELPAELPTALPAVSMASAQLAYPAPVADLPAAPIQLMNRAPRKMSIAERRMIRRTQTAPADGTGVRLYGDSERNVDPPAAPMRAPPKGLKALLGGGDSVDSPILGYFHAAGVSSRKPLIRELSPLAQIAQASRTSISVDEPLLSAVGAPQTMTIKEMVHEDAPPAPVSQAPPAQASQWRISPVMATDIEPDFPPELPEPQAARSFTVSPVIIVADLEPEAVPAESLQAVLASANLDMSSPPHLPLRSPLRKPSRPLSRIQHVPIKIAITPSNGSDVPETVVISRNSTPSMSTTQQHRLSKRLSLPLSISPSKLGVAPVDRRNSLRQQQQQKQQEQQQKQQQQQQVEQIEPPEKQSPEAPPKRRSVIVRERFQLEKTRKERELAEFIAQSTINSSPKTIETDSEHAIEDGTNDEARETDDLEQRLHRLEKHGGEWLNMLDPLLQNMSHTLSDLKGEKKGAPLLMDEFVIDMASEARRSMYHNGLPEPNDDAAKGSIFFEGFDGTHQPASFTAEQTSSRKSRGGLRSSDGDQSGAARHTKSSSDKSFLITETTDDDTDDSQTSSKQQSRQTQATQPPRTVQGHELEAQASIERRIQKQEAMMGQLLNRMDLLQSMSPKSPRSPRPPSTFRTGANEMTQSPRHRTSTRSRRNSAASSMVTIKPSRTGEERSDTGLDDLDRSLRALKAAPLTKYWLNKKDKSGTNRSTSRRGRHDSRRESWKSNKKSSRRWSAASRRLSWRQGEETGINDLMLELRNTSRLSGEWEDVEVIC